jgi:hypothetical protein
MLPLFYAAAGHQLLDVHQDQYVFNVPKPYKYWCRLRPNAVPA